MLKAEFVTILAALLHGTFCYIFNYQLYCHRLCCSYQLLVCIYYNSENLAACLTLILTVTKLTLHVTETHQVKSLNIIGDKVYNVSNRYFPNGRVAEL